MSTNPPNPNKANGTTSDPREQVMWDIYIEEMTKGRVNAYEAAVKAGYEDATAKQITTRRWFIERLEELERKEMLSDAEKLLRKTLRYNSEDKDGNVKVDLLRVQADVSKHITSTLGKDKGYSSRSELGGLNGKDLPTPLLYVLNNPGDIKTIET